MLALGLFTLTLIDEPPAPAEAAHTGWTDDPRLINIDSIEKLNLIRHDRDGNGGPEYEPWSGASSVPPAGAMEYVRTFLGAERAGFFEGWWRFGANAGHLVSLYHGCPGGCIGYELTKDLYLAGTINNWEPINNYSGVFDGNGHVIANLHILRQNERHVGLFRNLAAGGSVKNLGIVDADVKGYTGNESDQATGVIAGRNHGTIDNVFVAGKVSGKNGVGGIAGRSDGTIRTSWTDIDVQGGSNAGGLVGAKSGGLIHNTHSRGSVTGTSNVGGLVGALTGGGTVKHSYTIAETSAGFVLRGNSGGSVVASYDLEGTANALLKLTRRHIGIYSDWTRVWHLGHAAEYPALQVDFNDDGAPSVEEFGHDSAPQREFVPDTNDPTTDPNYHARLIDIDSIEKLNLIRHDLDGDGGPEYELPSGPDSVPPDGAMNYVRTFFGDEKAGFFHGWWLHGANAGHLVSLYHQCPGGCIGYELTADLDLDGHAVQNGQGWLPIGGTDNPYTGIFEGNGNTISNLYISRTSTHSDNQKVGLFGELGADAFVRGVGLSKVNITAVRDVGGLAGHNAGTIRESYVSGAVNGLVNSGRNLGGMVGTNGGGTIERSWAYVTVGGQRAHDVGGLVGRNLDGLITSSYAAGTVSGGNSIGGLVGGTSYRSRGDTIIDSYSWARVESNGARGGLIGTANNYGGLDFINSSYFDSSVQPGVSAVGRGGDSGGSGKTTAQLTAPTSNSGIYRNWDPGVWNFGAAGEYPLLKADFNGDGRATAAEFHQDHPGAPSGTIPYFADRTVYDRPANYDLKALIQNPLFWLRYSDITPLTLPAATGGDGTLTYSISPPLIAGVTFNPQTRTISGRPTLDLRTDTEIRPYAHVHQYTLTVTDEHGDLDAINFCIAYYDHDGADFSDRLALFGEEYRKIPDALAECNSRSSGTIRGVPGSGSPTFVFGDTPLLVKDFLGPFSQTLPAARGGSGELTYELKASAFARREIRRPVHDVVTGVRFDPATRTLGGTPLFNEGHATKHFVHHFTYTVTDQLGRKDEIRFCADHFMSYDYWRKSGFLALPGCSQSGDISLGERWVLYIDGETHSAGRSSATVAPTVLDDFGNLVPKLRFASDVGAVEFTHQADVGVFRLPGAEGGSGTRTYSLNPTTLPAGLSFDPATRAITGTPTAKQAPQTYTYTVSDTGGQLAQQTFTISVADDRQPTFAATPDDQVWDLFTDIGTIQLPQASGGNGTVTYTIEPDLPAGVTFDATARTLSGAPTASQAETSYTYTATDQDGDEVSLTFTIAVADLVVVPSLSFGDAKLYDYHWHQNVHNGRVNLPAATEGVAPLTYTVSPDLPAGLVFDPVALTIDGTPTEAQERVQYAYTVTDANDATASLPFSIVVIADVAPDFGEQAIANQSYTKYDNVGTVTLPAATGGDGELSYTLTPDLPAGLSFDAAARAITGAPTEALAETEYTYTATDFGGDTASLTFTIAVMGMGITMSVADQVTMREGEAVTYHVSLDAQPAANVVVEVTSDNGDVTVEPSSLTFTPDNWQTAQTVTVSAAHDPSDVNDQAVISHQIDGETVASFNVSVTDDDSDWEILRDFYQATGGDSWTDNDGWLSDKPLRYWHGVTTDSLGQVTHLALQNNNLSGSLPAQLGMLDGLQVISLDRNNISGSLPVELGNLSNLTRLAMNRNSLTGTIPTELGSLPNLSIIGLARNSLSGSLPTSLGNLGELTRLSLHDNTALSGALPDGFTGLANLQRLAIANTGLCAPDDEGFSNWLDTVSDKPGGVATCE